WLGEFWGVIAPEPPVDCFGRPGFAGHVDGAVHNGTLTPKNRGVGRFVSPPPHPYSDVFLVSSRNSRPSFGPPVKGSHNHEPVRFGRATDQYLPAIAADSAGTVAVCYYDRSYHPSNFLIDRTCALSTDAARTWRYARQTAASSTIPMPQATEFI